MPVCACVLAACVLAAIALTGCGSGQPKPVASVELAAAQTFPYYKAYWVGPSFEGGHVNAADGIDGYMPVVGEGVFYGDCVQGKGVFAGGGGCHLPLQVTTVIYKRHLNQPLGSQRNLVVHGVPAVIYDEGRSLELYTGHVAVDIFSDDEATALRAAEGLYPINAPGAAREPLPAPVYCPGLYGPQTAELRHVMESLPNHVCQKYTAQRAYLEAVKHSH